MGMNTKTEKTPAELFKALKDSDAVFIQADDVWRIIGCNPQSLRSAADTAEGCQMLGFPVTRMGNRTYIPRLAFIRWVEGGAAV